jgi:hypothetical protein
MKTPLYRCRSYQEFMSSTLVDADGKRIRGAVSEMANHIKCHSTFISQVIKGKADLSVDQIYLLASFCDLSESEVEYLINLYQMNRAGSHTTKKYFETRLKTLQDKSLNIKERLKREFVLAEEFHAQYLSSWLPQALHLFCQLPRQRDTASIAQYFRLPAADVLQTLQRLKEWGLIEEMNGEYLSIVSNLHFEGERPLTNLMHMSWRSKVLSSLQETPKSENVHFSSCFAVTTEAALEVRCFLIDTIERVAKIVDASEAREVHGLCMDFFKF